MQQEQKVTAGMLNGRMWAFLIIMSADVICSSMLMFYDMDSKQVVSKESMNKHNVKLDKILVFAFSGICAALYIALLFWYFFLIWKTFPFKFGLLGTLIKKVPILVATPFFIALFFVEKFLRIVSELCF